MRSPRRAVHSCRKGNQLQWFEPVANTPGFFRALASTLTELRLKNRERLPHTLGTAFISCVCVSNLNSKKSHRRLFRTHGVQFCSWKCRTTEPIDRHNEQWRKSNGSRSCTLAKHTGCDILRIGNTWRKMTAARVDSDRTTGTMSDCGSQSCRR